jgi:glycosyltransferase involved in cell wall biosynthesis
MRILAAMMTQNELLDLSTNIALLRQHVDSITVVDGGSIDGTIPWMRNMTRQDSRIRFFIHPWRDNFPEQRNNYLRRVGEIASDGDWVLAMDPDEFVEPSSLSRLRELAERFGGQYNGISLRCRSESYRGPDRVWHNEDEFRKRLFFKWRPDLRYTHPGEMPVHELLNGDPTNHGEDLVYVHKKQEDMIWPRGVRNYFCGGGGPNLGATNSRWVELKGIANRLGLDSWHRFHSYLIAGNIDGSLREWIIRYRHERGWDGSSEQREFFKTYFRMYHPEEEPAELRGEHIE